MADFTIVLRLVRHGRPTLNTYFGKIGSIWQSGNHLRNREGLVEFTVDDTELYAKMSALGTQCVFITQDHFHSELNEMLAKKR
jgi:hypothetical protein